MSIKKKILAGLLGGALLFAGGQAFAAPPEMPDDQTWQEQEAKNIGGWAKYLSDKYGVDSAQVEAALNDGVHIEDVKHAAVLAKLSGKNFSDVLAMKVDWAPTNWASLTSRLENFTNKSAQNISQKWLIRTLKLLRVCLRTATPRMTL